MICQQPLAQKTNSIELNAIIKQHLAEFTETNDFPAINHFSFAPTFHGIAGIFNLDCSEADLTENMPSYQIILFFKLELNNLYSIPSTVPKINIPQTPLEIFSPVC